MSRTVSKFGFSMLLLAVILLAACRQNSTSQQGGTVDSQPLFTSLPASQTGVVFQNEIPENSRMNSMVYEYFYNGGGVATGDINNDGLPDLYFVANLKDNKLYLNQGNFTFEDITEKAGVQGSFGWSTGVTMADVNADGWLDIYVCKSGKGKPEDRENELFLNRGDGTFEEAAAKFGLNFPGYSTQAAFFDYDRDGDLDCFLLNHNVTPVNTNNPEIFKAKNEEWVGDKLFRNDAGKFTDVSRSAGLLGNPLGFGLGVSIGDLNNDGWPDIYVGNDYIEQDYLYLNNGDGTFIERGKQATGHTSNFSMGTDIADFNNDGWADLISLDMVAEDNYGIKTSMSGMNPAAFNHAVAHGFHYQYMFNALQLNNGFASQNADGQLVKFSEMAHLAGVSNTDWSWAPLLADFDNDGWKDLFVTNGLKRDFRNNDFRKHKLERLAAAKKNSEDMAKVVEELVAQTPQRKTANYLFRNNGDLTFSKKTTEWGIGETSFSNGAAYADLDADGDLDLVVNNIDSPAFILQNNCRQRYLQFELRGMPGNTFGIGAKVILHSENGTQVAENYPTRGYQSAVEPMLHFGLGNANEVEQVDVIWPDGRSQFLENVSANKRLTLNYADAKPIHREAAANTPAALFQDITSAVGINHRHVENDFDDFARESLLPHKMSEFGPALAVGDVNADGLEDFFIGGAKGHAGELYFQQTDGSFQPSAFPIWQKEKDYEDVAATFFDADNDGDLDLYVVSGGNEMEPESPLLQDRLYLNDSKKQFVTNGRLLPKMPASGSCVKPFDFDNDGDLDLFVGGRQVPGKYPFPASSFLLKNDGGMFEDVTVELAPALAQPGMVTDALWTDFDGDGQTDLIVVGEWMPLRFFKNQDGSLQPATPSILQSPNPSILKTEGWWSSIASTDFDSDGDTDYLVGNLGLNYKYRASAEAPFEVYCHDFDENGSLDIVLGYHNQGGLYPLRGRECSSGQMPFLKEKYPDYHSFGSASLVEMYGEAKLAAALHLQAHQFASVYLENLGGGKFNLRPLPNRAQLSSVNGILPGDWNGDGKPDAIIAGNMHQSEVETPRNDASIGLFLQNAGVGKWTVVPPFESGLYLGGDVKKLAVIQLGNGGSATTAFLVGNNNSELQLIQIVKGKRRL